MTRVVRIARPRKERYDRAADSAVVMLQEGERLSRLWRYIFVQMLDDYTSVLRLAGVSAACALQAAGTPRTITRYSPPVRGIVA